MLLICFKPYAYAWRGRLSVSVVYAFTAKSTTQQTVLCH